MKNNKTSKTVKLLFAILVVFAILLVFLYIFPQIDEWVYRFFLSWQTQQGIEIVSIFTLLGSTWPIILISILILLALVYGRKYKETAFYLAVLAGGVFLDVVLKNLIGRARPLNPFENGFSFPSGHTGAAAAAYWALAYILLRNSKAKYNYLFISAFFALPFLVGLSRLYLGVHWLSDVVGGLLIGCVWLLVCIYFYYESSIN